MYRDYRVIDADGHVLEPADQWEKWIDKEFRARAPRGSSPSSTHRARGHGHAPRSRRRRARGRVRGRGAHAVENMGACMDLIVGGVLERHAKLRCVFLESGSGWGPWWLGRMDEHFEGYFGPIDAPYLTMEPSAYFERQCWISTEVDEKGTANVAEVLGADRIVLGSDYPHGDGKFPRAIAEFVAVPKLADEVKRKILWDKPARLYGLCQESQRRPEPQR